MQVGSSPTLNIIITSIDVICLLSHDFCPSSDTKLLVYRSPMYLYINYGGPCLADVIADKMIIALMV